MPEPRAAAPGQPFGAALADAPLSARAGALARSHTVSRSGPARPGEPQLFARLRRIETLLWQAHRKFTAAAETDALPYAAEWLLDNLHLLEQAFRQIRDDLPAGYYRQLPILEMSPLGGYPRIYAIAWDILSLLDGQFGAEETRAHLLAYQAVALLATSEIWAAPIMLRIVVLEQLAQAVSVAAASPDRMEPLAASAPPEDAAAADRAVANGFRSLRALATTDWKEFFESVSPVERVLRDDPASRHAAMDFDTRDQYRKAVERLARASQRDEVEVARQAVTLAGLASDRDGAQPGTARQAHAGYYLLDEADGVPALERALGYRPLIGQRLLRRIRRNPAPLYLGLLALSTLAILGLLAGFALRSGAAALQVALVISLGVFPASSAAISLVNWFCTLALKVRVLPKMDFSQGVPDNCRAMVVMPTLISSAAEVDHLVEQLELQRLRNADAQLGFALLTDFTDAPRQHMPDDHQLVERAAAAIERLNERYQQDGAGRPFYLFHRERRWNPAENCWMGWERKRGKLAEFNRLLRGARDTTFAVQRGDLSFLPRARYVITLDADTVLPHGSARRLIGTLAHPLNRAEFAPDGRRVAAGYTILQPRTAARPEVIDQSPFTRVFAGDRGLDLYTRAVSDVYQDLFGEGIYVGKGIYDVDAFERSLAGRVPENALLSHDLFEGIHGRAGLATDVVLFEDYPPHYLAYAGRAHRWIRGDWQLLPWLGGQVPLATGAHAPTPLKPIDRWKMLDNLRRSLVSPAMVALLAAAWLWLPGSATAWGVLLSACLAVPALTSLARRAVSKTAARLRNDRVSPAEMARPVALDFLRWALELTFLPHQALLSLDAIGTTLVRVGVTHRRLLQWTPAARMAALFAGGNGWATVGLRMLPAVAVVAAACAGIAALKPGALVEAALFLAAWLASPWIAHAISQPEPRRVNRLAARQRRQLRSIARRTWLYFERFVGPEDNWLPPDHYQEDPLGTAAHSTSPTNIGLMLLSSLAAHDLGYIRRLELQARLEAAFSALGRLQRHRGHFLNWHDTRSLAPLQPAYVSTVDSGNLAACLLALGQGLDGLCTGPVLRRERWDGFLDILALLEEAAAHLSGAETSQHHAALMAHLNDLARRVQAIQEEPGQWAPALESLHSDGLRRLSSLTTNWLDAAEGADAQALAELRTWADRAASHLQSMRDEFSLWQPWSAAFRQPPSLIRTAAPDSPTARAWRALRDGLPPIADFGQLASLCVTARERLAVLDRALDTDHASAEAAQARNWCAQFASALASARDEAALLKRGSAAIAEQARSLVAGMDFAFLYDESRMIFRIGYDVAGGRLDANAYDLLASEARIASLVAIAKGDAPAAHWLHLSRPITLHARRALLLSWSGTLFEYLMPRLFIRDYPDLLLDRTSRAVVDVQRRHGAENHTPWGVSESAYHAFDASLNYQYRAFGVPGLGYKRDLGEDLVVAPYASLLALQVAPQEVMDNISALIGEGLLGRYGFYEAADYTVSRLAPGAARAIVKSYYVHHQGMILLSIANALCEDVMTQRFHADPRIRSVELLLQERPPEGAPVEYPHREESQAQPRLAPPVDTAPWEVPALSPAPQAHLLSNGSYTVVVTSAGGGFSQWQDIALTHWSADATLEETGTWIYVQDCDSGALWSVTQQPVGAPPVRQTVIFSPHQAEFRREDGDLALQTEITVAPDRDVEIRRVTVTNNGDQPRRLRLTSYAEAALAHRADHERHPAFSKLFVECERLEPLSALLFWRRPRSSEEKPVHMAHALVCEPGLAGRRACESDRAQFLGRGLGPRDPLALKGDAWLSGATGATLDPILALGQEITIQPRSQARLAFLTLASRTREEVLEALEHFQAWHAIDRAFQHAQARCELELRQLGLSTPELARMDRLMSALLYSDPATRADPAVLSANTMGQSGLYAFGISGDYPIVLLQTDDARATILDELLRAHAYWRERQIRTNLVIVLAQASSYHPDQDDELHRALSIDGGHAWLNRRDGLFVVRSDRLSEADRVLLKTVARAVFDASLGSLAEQLSRRGPAPPPLPDFLPSRPPRDAGAPAAARPRDLQFDNGYGGFTCDGREYAIFLRPGEWTPAPWVNVIANPAFGFLASEAGADCTWAANSGENRLTPWRNDPVRDTPSEAIYLRDEETGQVWTPTPLPAGAGAPCLIRHGAGYTTYEHGSHGLEQHVRVYAATGAPVKLIELELRNAGDEQRRVSATFFAEWALGASHEANHPYIVTEYDHDAGALLARNTYSAEFAERIAFVSCSRPIHGLTADRAEFLGRLGDRRRPAALARIGLSGTVGAGLDPCAALQVHAELAPGEEQRVVFAFGQGNDRAHALQLAQTYREPAQAESAWQATQKQWDSLLGAVAVTTPDPSLDVMLNRWLLYQALACRLWGRSALYQSSGAFGFRDQLQDVMALMHAAPELARAHILEAARRQFAEGDVLHWWHPPGDRGVRTRCSDDLVWLPYVACHYVACTGDDSILDEELPFLHGEPLRPEDTERYGQFSFGSETGSLFEHCRRALRRAGAIGPHGLPLIGSGDWNDGFNRIGRDGRGESVWLGWFLHATLMRFADVCETRGDGAQASACREQAARLLAALEKQAWDGAWYRRAYYDDGEPIGSARNRECRIDSIAQSWAVLSGAGDAWRARRAMESVLSYLVSSHDQLVLLFTPPFNRTSRDPGYVKGYVPGARENGGQYTHAAVWAAWAFATLGEGDRAGSLFGMLNPVNHSDTADKARTYRVEPYAVAADVHSAPPRLGRGGWTWYTGSASWMYRLGIEGILGLQRRGRALVIEPCIPSSWPGYQLTYQQSGATYHIRVQNPERVCRGVREVTMDGRRLADGLIPLAADGQVHEVVVTMGASSS